MTETGLTETLMSSGLFEGFSADEIDLFLSRKPGSVVRYQKKDIIKGKGKGRMPLTCILSGAVDIQREYPDGTVIMLARKEKGDVIGLTSFDKTMKRNQMHYYKAERDTVLFCLKAEYLNNSDYLGETCYGKLAGNLNRILSNELAVQCTQQEILLTKSLRRKLMTYLQEEQQKQGSREFDIPYTRDELALRLYVNRSALSREVGRMTKEGLIEACGKHFAIKW